MSSKKSSFFTVALMAGMWLWMVCSTGEMLWMAGGRDKQIKMVADKDDKVIGWGCSNKNSSSSKNLVLRVHRPTYYLITKPNYE